MQELIANVPIYHDPWEDYYLRQTQIEEEENQKKLELQRLREEEDRQRRLREVEARRQFEEELERTRLEMEELEVKRREVEEVIYQQRRHEEERQIWEEAQRKEREEAEERIRSQQDQQEKSHWEEESQEIEEEQPQMQQSETVVQNHIPSDEFVPEVRIQNACYMGAKESSLSCFVELKVKNLLFNTNLISSMFVCVHAFSRFSYTNH